MELFLTQLDYEVRMKISLSSATVTIIVLLLKTHLFPIREESQREALAMAVEGLASGHARGMTW